MNLEIRQFEQTLVLFINDQPLPIEAKRLVVRDILNQIEAEAKKAIQAEIDAKNAIQAENEVDNGIPENNME